MEKVALFVFITSLIYNLYYLVKIIVNLKLDTPDPIEFNPITKITLLLSTAYMITYIISLF